MSKPKITIIGLGLTGTSIGLSLQRESGNFEIIGHDKESDATRNALQLEAIHKQEWNLHRAYDGADMVVLAVPFSELDELFGHISADLKPGCLILAMTTMMQPTIDLANQHLSDQVHFVAGHPTLTGVGGTLSERADLFDGVIFSLATDIRTGPEAVQLASDFVERLGAKPHFVDAHEHDGIIAGVEQLPQLLAASLMRVSTASPSWHEAKRMAGRPFAQATELGHGPQELFSAMQQNRENLVLRISQMQQELQGWQQLLEAETQPDEKHPLLEALESITEDRERWEAQAELKRWEDLPSDSRESGKVERQNNLLSQMFFGNLMRRRAPNGENR